MNEPVENPARNTRLYHLLVRKGHGGHLRRFANKLKESGILTVADYEDRGHEIKTTPANRGRVRAIFAELGLPNYAAPAPTTPSGS